jgi:hypothetical protein
MTLKEITVHGENGGFKLGCQSWIAARHSCALPDGHYVMGLAYLSPYAQLGQELIYTMLSWNYFFSKERILPEVRDVILHKLVLLLVVCE